MSSERPLQITVFLGQGIGLVDLLLSHGRPLTQDQRERAPVSAPEFIGQINRRTHKNILSAVSPRTPLP